MNGPALNILQIYYEPTPAGQTRHVSVLVRSLARRHRVAVVAPAGLPVENWASSNHRSEKVGDKARNIQVVRLPMRKLIWPPHTLLARQGVALAAAWAHRRRGQALPADLERAIEGLRAAVASEEAPLTRALRAFDAAV